MTDSLKVLDKFIESKSNDVIDLITKVDTFYNSAWQKLIIVGSVAFAFIGIVLPLIIQWYQKKTLSLSEELLKKEIESQVQQIKSKIIYEINHEIEEKFIENKKEISNLYSSTNAKAFHLQGNLMLEKKLYPSALEDYITASFSYLKCNDYQNLQTVLYLIDNSCMPYISLEDLDDIKTISGSDLNLLIEELKEKDVNGSLTKIIRNITLKIQKAPKLHTNKENAL